MLIDMNPLFTIPGFEHRQAIARTALADLSEGNQNRVIKNLEQILSALWKPPSPPRADHIVQATSLVPREAKPLARCVERIDDEKYASLLTRLARWHTHLMFSCGSAAIQDICRLLSTCDGLDVEDAAHAVECTPLGFTSVVLIAELEKIHPSQRARILENLTAILKEHRQFDEAPKLIQSLAHIPQEERDEVVGRFIHLLKNAKKDFAFYAHALLERISAIPRTQWPSIVDALHELRSLRHNRLFPLHDIMDKLLRCPADKRSEAALRASVFCCCAPEKQLEVKYLLKALNMLSHVPPQHWVYASELFIRESDAPNACMLDAMPYVPSTHWENLYSFLKTQRPQPDTGWGIVNAYVKAHPIAREAILDHLTQWIGSMTDKGDASLIASIILSHPLCSGNSNSYGKDLQSLLHAAISSVLDDYSCEGVPMGQKEEIVKRVISLLPSYGRIVDFREICRLFRQIGTIPQKDREHFVQRAQIRIRELCTSTQMLPGSQLKEIVALPEERVHRFLDCISKRSSPIDKGLRVWVYAGAMRASEHCLALLAKCPSIPLSNAKDIDRFINYIPEAQRDSVVEDTQQLLNSLQEPIVGIVHLTCWFMTLSQDERSRVLEIARLMPDSITSTKNLLALQFVPHELRVPLFQHGLQTQHWNEAMRKYLTEFPRDKAVVHEYLRHRLHNTIDAQLALGLAQILLDDLETFQIGENDELFLDACLVRSDALSNEPKNPYRVYGHLARLAQKPDPTIALEPQTIEGKSVILSRDDLKALPMRIKYRELPEVVDPKDLFDAFDQRMNALSWKEKNVLLGKIAEAFSEGYAFIKANALQNPKIQSFLKREDPEKDAPIPLACFAKVMQHIAALTPQVPPGEPWSPREYALLSAFHSLRGCNTGTRETTMEAYNLFVPQDMRYVQLQSAYSPEEERARAFLVNVVQHAQEHMISAESAFMQEMTGATPPIAQMSHQTLYVKNLIGTRIGLWHTLEFDRHTPLLKSPLLEWDVKQALEKFYKHFTPQVLVDWVKRAIDATDPVMHNAKLYNSLNALLPEHELEAVWMMHATTGKYAISSAAVRDILQRVGYLQKC